MRPNFLRLASPERAERKAGGQPAQPDINPSLELKNPASGSIEECSGTPTPKQQIAEVTERTPTASEHISDRFINMHSSPAQFNLHTLTKNPNPRLYNQLIHQIPTIIGKAILLTLIIRDIDGTGRPPECAYRLLFHVPSSSIRGSPGSFAVFLIIGDFMRRTMQGFFGSFLSFTFTR